MYFNKYIKIIAKNPLFCNLDVTQTAYIYDSSSRKCLDFTAFGHGADGIYIINNNALILIYIIIIRREKNGKEEQQERFYTC